MVNNKPRVVLDGAQNEHSSRILRQAVIDNFSYKRLILVLGISQDKDIPGICRNLCPLADKIIITRADNPRSSRPEDIEKVIIGLAGSYSPKIIKTNSVRQARTIALKMAGSRDMVLVAGSLFVVGEFRKYVFQHR